jgi:hypothetical protein
MIEIQDEFYAEFHENELDRIEREKQAFIRAGVDQVDAAKWAADQIYNYRVEKAQEWLSAINSVFSAGMGVVSAYNTLQRQELQRTMAMYDERMDKLEAQHERQLEFAESQGASDEELTELKQRQEEERARLEEEKEKRRAKLEKQAFKREKRAQLAEATMAGAQAVVQALTAGPIAGPILASAIAAMTATQLALISQQQYPGLASGGIVPAQGEGGGLYRLGDKNKAETVIPFDVRKEGGIGTTVNISANLYGAGSMEKFATTVDKALRRAKARGAA